MVRPAWAEVCGNTLSLSNRTVRTRMPGGVTGGGVHIDCRLCLLSRIDVDKRD